MVPAAGTRDVQRAAVGAPGLTLKEFAFIDGTEDAAALGVNGWATTVGAGSSITTSGADWLSAVTPTKTTKQVTATWRFNIRIRSSLLLEIA